MFGEWRLQLEKSLSLFMLLSVVISVKEVCALWSKIPVNSLLLTDLLGTFRLAAFFSLFLDSPIQFLFGNETGVGGPDVASEPVL